MKTIVLDGTEMLTKEATHAYLAQRLELPDYYGRNLDALWDLLGEKQWQITLTNVSEMIEGLGVYGEKLVQTFREAETVELTEE